MVSAARRARRPLEAVVPIAARPAILGQDGERRYVRVRQSAAACHEERPVSRRRPAAIAQADDKLSHSYAAKILMIRHATSREPIPTAGFGLVQVSSGNNGPRLSRHYGRPRVRPARSTSVECLLAYMDRLSNRPRLVDKSPVPRGPAGLPPPARPDRGGGPCAAGGPGPGSDPCRDVEWPGRFAPGPASDVSAGQAMAGACIRARPDPSRPDEASVPRRGGYRKKTNADLTDRT